MNGKSLINIKNYGSIKIKLKEVMNKKDITKNGLSVLTGVKFSVDNSPIESFHSNLKRETLRSYNIIF